MERREERGDSIRAFIAAEICDEVRSNISALLDKLAKHSGVKWVRPQSMHLTLRFLGNITPGQVDVVGKAMDEAVEGKRPLAVEVSGWGSFPPAKRPRVFWLGLAKGEAELSAIFTDLEAALIEAGLGAADKPFSPHLTLGRVKSGKGLEKVVKSLEHKAAGSFGVCRVERICLLRSELRPEGARYTVLKESKLGSR